MGTDQYPVVILGDRRRSALTLGDERARPTRGSSLGVGIRSLSCFLCFLEEDSERRQPPVFPPGVAPPGRFSWSWPWRCLATLGEVRYGDAAAARLSRFSACFCLDGVWADLDRCTEAVRFCFSLSGLLPK